MEFHLPFFALREAPVSDNQRPTPIGKRLRDWEDITFLTRDEAEPEGQKTFRLHKAQISCVINGSGECSGQLGRLRTLIISREQVMMRIAIAEWTVMKTYPVKGLRKTTRSHAVCVADAVDAYLP